MAVYAMINGSVVLQKSLFCPNLHFWIRVEESEYNMKILTFVIPAYNSESFLDKCLTSMVSSTVLDQIEVIVVSDGSTDGTEAIAEKYCAEYPGSLRLIVQENKGHGGALNTGCVAATGKYLKVIDSDDWIETENLPAFLDILKDCSSDVVLTHHHTIDISTGEIRNWKSYPPCFCQDYSFGQIMDSWKSFDRSLTFHGITYRTEFYHKQGVQLSEHVFYEDHEYATFPCCLAKTVFPVDLFLYDYRIGDVSQSVSEGNQLKRLGHTKTVLNRMAQLYQALPEGDGKAYAGMKIQGLLLSYLTTVLLSNPDKKAGRQEATDFIKQYKTLVPAVCDAVHRKAQVFFLMNRFHVNKKCWDSILASGLYNRLRKNHSFQ